MDIYTVDTRWWPKKAKYVSDMGGDVVHVASSEELARKFVAENAAEIGVEMKNSGHDGRWWFSIVRWTLDSETECHYVGTLDHTGKPLAEQPRIHDMIQE